MDVQEHGRYPSTDRTAGGPVARWPARTQRLLGEIRALYAKWLHEPLQACLGDFDTRLQQEADRARSHLDQQRYLVTCQRLRRDRQAFNTCFIASVDRAFGQIGATTAKQAASVDQPLSLLDPLEHEVTAALDQLVARSEARGGPVMAELGYRLAVLIGSPPLEGDALPLGPQAVAKSFREASAALTLPKEHELLLLQSLESSLMQGLTPLYNLINTHLQADGILPRLRAFSLPRAAPRPRPRRAVPIPGASAAPDTPVAQTTPPQPIAVLDNLRELLAHQRAEQALPTSGAARAATSDELQMALGALQQHLSQVSDHVSRELRSAQRLREELLTQLNAGRPAGAPSTDLSAEQNDMVALVAMLFEQMGRQLHEGGNARSLLGGLQLPLLRAAVADRQFFEERDHPARQLLGKLTEVAHDWLDAPGGESDHGLRAKLEQLVDRANREPPSAGLYTILLADIEQHLGLLRRKAQVAERRHVEAMQGRERLEQARHRAAELMAERFLRSSPHGLLRTLLERAWADVLALTLLRHGEQSEAFATRLVITDQLLGLLPSGNRQQLQDEVEAGLQQIGMHGDEAVQLAQRLLGAAAPTADGAAAPSTTGLALRLKQHQRLGEAAGDASRATTAAAPKPALNAQEKRLQQRLRELPYGSWFEFVDPASGRVHQRKLAWFSPLSGRSLFVTRRGLRAEEMSLPQLARAIGSGQVREMPARDGLLDRAWHALTGSLRQAPHPPQPGARA